jgi:death-on-curing protein
MLESALARPVNQHAYGQPDVFDLAAAYGYGIVKNHPFVDGNKRTAFLAAYVFLRSNGWLLRAPQVETVQSILSLADGSLDEPGFAKWLRSHSNPA